MEHGTLIMTEDDVKKIQSFKDLIVWQQAHQLVIKIYKITKKYPRDEQFGLVSQMRRSAVSITSNIAEGFVRKSYKEKVTKKKFTFTTFQKDHYQSFKINSLLVKTSVI